MPITNNGSYITTMQQFSDNWNTINAHIAPDVIKLEGGYLRSAFVADIVTLDSALTDISNALTNLTTERTNLRNYKINLMNKLEQFRQQVIANMASSNYRTSLPTLPKIGSVQSRFLRPFDQAVNLWTQINAAPPPGFTAPLKVNGTYTLAMFQTDIANLRSEYLTLIAVEGVYKAALEKRNTLCAAARAHMVQYRNAVFARLSKTDPYRSTVPRYSPVAGATPKPVTNLQFTYAPTTNLVHITFTPATSANIIKYQLEFAPGPKWNDGNAMVIATNDNLAPFAFDFELKQVGAGDLALFKVFTVNETENMKASKVLKIKRADALTLTGLAASHDALEMAA